MQSSFDIMGFISKNPWIWILVGLGVVLIIKGLKNKIEESNLSPERHVGQTSSTLGHSTGDGTPTLKSPQAAAKKGATFLIILGFLLPLAIRIFTKLKLKENNQAISQVDVRDKSGRSDSATQEDPDWNSFRDEFKTAIKDEDWTAVFDLTHPGSQWLTPEKKRLYITSEEDLKKINASTWNMIRFLVDSDLLDQNFDVDGKEVKGKIFPLPMNKTFYEVLFYINPDTGKWGWGGLKK